MDLTAQSSAAPADESGCSQPPVANQQPLHASILKPSSSSAVPQRSQHQQQQQQRSALLELSDGTLQTRNLLLRGMCLIYLMAFVGFYYQSRGEFVVGRS